MKSIFTISAALLLSGAVSAQITITNSIGYKVGDSYSAQPCIADFEDLGAEGANVTVNLSGLMNEGSVTTVSFVSPASTGHAASFPGANIAQPASTTGGNSGYGYFNSGSSKIEILGVHTNAYTMVYSNPMTMLTFPMNYLDSTYDDFAASYSVNGIDVFRSGYVSTVADAWGTITTPAGTFPYLRFYTVQVNIDTFYMEGEIAGMSYSETYTYNYMGNNSQAPLYAYSEVWTGSGASALASYAVNVFPTATNEVSEILEATSVYPNPASSSANVNFTLKQSSNVSISIVDITGKEVATMNYTGLKAGKHQYPIAIESLATGLYSAIIKTDGAQQQMKFIVE